METEKSTIIEFIDEKSPNFNKTFANSVIFELSPFHDVVLDFLEEYLITPQISRQVLGEDGSIEMSHPWHVVKIVREKKCSVTMKKDQAIQLANLILERLQEGVSNDDRNA